MPSLFGPDLPDAHFAALGRMMSAWASLEQFIDTMCAVLLGGDMTGAHCLTAQIMGPGRKLDALLALMAHKGASEQTLARTRSLAGRVVGLGNRRNRMAYDPWSNEGVGDDGYDDLIPGATSGLFAGLKRARKFAPHRREITAQKRLVIEHKRVETAEIDALTAEIEAMWQEFIFVGHAIDADIEANEKACKAS